MSFPRRAGAWRCSLQESEQDSELTHTEDGRDRLIQPHSVTMGGPFITTWPSELRSREEGSKQRKRVGASSPAPLGGKEHWGILTQGGSPLSTYPYVAGL